MILFFIVILKFLQNFDFFECTVNEQASCKLEHNNVFLYKKTNYHFLLKNIFFLRFLDISYWMSIFYVKLINCCTYVALLFFFTFFGGLRNIFGTLRWSKKWENEEFVEELSETLIFILKKKQKILSKYLSIEQKCK